MELTAAILRARHGDASTTCRWKLVYSGDNVAEMIEYIWKLENFIKNIAEQSADVFLKENWTQPE